MIQVNKPCPPSELAQGKAATRIDCEKYAANRCDYEDGSRKFEFKSTIYGHKKVKEALKKAQHDKCCFCEGKFGAFAPGDVEHYRPKGAVRQDDQSPRMFPGYFWLVYSWENLYWSCQVCNRIHKKDLFPIENPGDRACSPTDDITMEKPLILDPGAGGSDDPSKHINFEKEIAIGKTRKGKETIKMVGMNRSALREQRLTHLKQINSLLDVVKLGTNRLKDPSILEAAQKQLCEFVTSKAEFSSMANDRLIGIGFINSNSE